MTRITLSLSKKMSIHQILYVEPLFNLVREYVGYKSYVPLGILSKYTHSIWKCKKTSWRVISNSKKSICYYHDFCGSHFLSKCITFSAKNGLVDDIVRLRDWFEESDIKILGKRSRDTMKVAVKSRSMRTVKVCAKMGYFKDTSVLLEAVKEKNIRMVKYLLVNGCKSSIDCEIEAASIGNVTMLKLLNPSEKFDTMVMAHAAKMGQIGVIAYMDHLGVRVDARVALMAVSSGILDRVKMVIDVFGYPVDETSLTLSINRKYTDISGYLNGFFI